jgi:DMSO reductase anchor subunit
MNPAFSVIAFTTLSGAGYGLWFWCALASLLSPSRSGALLIAMIVGFVLVSVGLSSSLAHLGKPQRAWRAFSQWRTSWLSREGVAAMLTFVPAIGLGALSWRGGNGLDTASLGADLPLLRSTCAVLLAAGSLATVACTAMIYASLVPIPAWRHRLVLPVYLLFALLTGGLLALLLARPVFVRFDALPAWVVLALVIALALAKRRYWRDIDTAGAPAALGAAVGLPQRQLGVFERPNTEANYLTREMGFVLARRHAARLRRIALVAFAVLPALCVLPAGLFAHVDATPWHAVAALAALLGAGVERWLFFAQARHVVSVYYGIAPSA